MELARRGSGKAGHRPRPALRPGGALAGGALAPPPRPRALLCPRRAWVRGAAGRGVPAHRPPLPKPGRGRPDGPAGLGLTGCSPRRRAPSGRDPGGGNPAPAEALEAPRPYRWRGGERSGAPGVSSAGPGQLPASALPGQARGLERPGLRPSPPPPGARSG